MENKTLNNQQILELKVKNYERRISEMQGHVFFCQDNLGTLRRWNPPKLVSFDPETYELLETKKETP